MAKRCLSLYAALLSCQRNYCTYMCFEPIIAHFSRICSPLSDKRAPVEMALLNASEIVLADGNIAKIRTILASFPDARNCNGFVLLSAGGYGDVPLMQREKQTR